MVTPVYFCTQVSQCDTHYFAWQDDVLPYQSLGNQCYLLKDSSRSVPLPFWDREEDYIEMFIKILL